MKLKLFVVLMMVLSLAGGVYAGEMAGRWSTYSTTISKQEITVFEEAMKSIQGVAYRPFAVATQEVNGINYRFLCNAKGQYPDALNEAAMVQLYAPLRGPVAIREIKIVQ